MFPFPDHHYTMDRPFSGHHDVSLPPPLELDLSSSSSFFFPFSPPTFHQDSSFYDLLTAHLGETHSLTPPTVLSPIKEIAVAAAAPPPTKNASLGRKRALRKVHHSKIITAQGLRDRRMRLSLEVARKFFDLQDMLGFDKASKTVLWLLTASKASIKDLTIISRPKAHSLSGVSSSKGTEVSASELEWEAISTLSGYKGKSSTNQEENITSKAKRVGRQPSRRAAFPPTLARELRTKARARARERTREKKRMLQSGRLKDGGSEWNKLLSFSIPYEAIEKESGSHDLKSTLQLVAEAEEQCSPSPDQCKQPAAGGSGSITILDYNQNTIGPKDAVNLFQEQWDMNFASSIEDVQLQTRLWEA